MLILWSHCPLPFSSLVILFVVWSTHYTINNLRAKSVSLHFWVHNTWYSLWVGIQKIGLEWMEIYILAWMSFLLYINTKKVILWTFPFLGNYHNLYVKLYLSELKHNDLVYIKSVNFIRPFLWANFRWHTFYWDRILFNFSNLLKHIVTEEEVVSKKSATEEHDTARFPKKTTVGCR